MQGGTQGGAMSVRARPHRQATQQFRNTKKENGSQIILSRIDGHLRHDVIFFRDGSGKVSTTTMEAIIEQVNFLKTEPYKVRRSRQFEGFQSKEISNMIKHSVKSTTALPGEHCVTLPGSILADV